MSNKMKANITLKDVVELIKKRMDGNCELAQKAAHVFGYCAMEDNDILAEIEKFATEGGGFVDWLEAKVAEWESEAKKSQNDFANGCLGAYKSVLDFVKHNFS